ncbi:MAG TPA: GNAT family N-acetyltransferase, partial [Chitinophagaceae bacterium]|nr:GNAT family N-acetyltransferase [Chitinophagaceae bacterium]
WFEKHSTGKRPLWIVKNEQGELIGWVSFTNFYGRPAYAATAEISIYLSTARQCKGYGKQILNYCINNCKSLHIENLIGFIFAHNEPSLKLFHSCGFTDWGLLPDIAVLDGVKRSLKIVGRHVS